MLNSQIKFEKNQVIYDTLEKVHRRILYVYPDQSLCYWIETESDSNVPKPFSLQDLSFKVATGTCELVVDPLAVKPDSDPSESMIRIRDERVRLIRDVVTKEPEIYERSARKALLEDAAAQNGVTFSNLYRYLGLYWRNGMTENALLPSYNNCGKSRDTSAPQKKRMGRPAKETDKYGNQRVVYGKTLTEEDYSRFRKAYHEFYLQSGRKGKWSRAYERMKNELYTVPSPENPMQRIVLPAKEIPSLAQFRWWCSKNEDVVEDMKEKEGQNQYDLHHRSITGNSEKGLFGPGAVAQIDATLADYYLVRETNRASVIGRPTLYFIRDTYSHIIMGMYITLDPPSWNSALMALKNCADDKVTYCKQFGVEITPETWPCNCLPYSITADNGEMKGTGVEELIRKLGITVDNCPAYRGDLKGIIEKSFGTLNIHLQDITPGYVDKDQGERGAHDYRRDACLDLKQFTRIVIHCVLFYNNAHCMDTYVPTPQMRALGVLPVPRDIWNFGVRYASGAMRTIPSLDILRVLLPKETATVTERGLRLHDLYYTCEKARKENWFSVARIQGRSKVSAAYDPTCVDHIYIFEEGGEVLTCDLVGRSTEFTGATAEEAERWKTENKTRCETYRATQEAQASADLHWKALEIIQSAQKAGADEGEIKRVLNKHNILKEREAERRNLSGADEALKEQEIFFGPSSDKEPDSSPDSNPVLDDIAKALEDAGLI